MFKKINVLASVLQMGRPFTLEEVAESSGVVSATVRSVLQRYDGLFEQKKLPPTGRGGQRIEYTLTDEGRQALLAELGRLPAVDKLPSRTPLAPALRGDVPEPLLAVEGMLRGMADIPAAEIPAFLERAERRLGWAAEEASNQSLGAQKSEIERRIAAAHEAIATARPAAQTSAELAVEARQPVAPAVHVRHLDTFAPGMAFVAALSISAAPLQTTAHRLANALRRLVFIHSVGHSAAPLQFAMVGDGALLTLERACRLWSPSQNLHIERLDIEDAKRAWAGSERGPSSNADVLLCFNSQEEPAEVERALDAIQSTKILSSGLLLDVGYSHFVDDFATRESRFEYQCRVRDFPVNWVDFALSKVHEVSASRATAAAAAAAA